MPKIPARIGRHYRTGNWMAYWPCGFARMYPVEEQARNGLHNCQDYADCSAWGR